MNPSLYTAAMEGELDVLKQYTDRFALQFTKNNNTVLHVIAEFGHSHCVADILSACPPLLRRENTHGDTPLHIAAAGGHDDVVESLINFAKPPAENQNNEIAAANNGGGEGGVALAVREMLKVRNHDGDTPLHLAARYRDPLRVVSLLTKADRELDYRPNKAGETPLYLVVDRGSDAAVVSEILKNCKSPAYGGPGRRTALHAAVFDSSKDAILDKLLDWKQDLIKERDTKGWTSLHFAAHNGNLEAVKKLLDKDKSVAYANNDEGNTALHIATATGDVLVMNEILLRFPDCWEMANSKGRTILHIAADVERDVATNFILKKPSVSRLINRKDNEGNTPLHVLASKGKAGIHMYPGADMLALNNETMTPLDVLNREIAGKGGSLDKMSVYTQTRRKDDHDVVKTMEEYMAEMEQRIESLLNQRLATRFEQLQSKMFQYMESRSLEARQVPDAVSGHRTVRESIEDDTSPMERSHRPPTHFPAPSEKESRESQVKETKDEDSSYLVQGGKPNNERIENKQSEYDLNLKGSEMKQTNKDEHISKEENVKKLFTNNYNLSSLITEKDTDFLDTILEWKNGDENAVIWSSGCDHACIFLKDFLLLLQEGDVGNTLIDGYTFLLEKLQKEDSNSLFFTSMCWSLIRLNNKQIGDEKSPQLTHLIDTELEQLDNKLQQKRDYFRYLVFPMNSTGNRDEDGTPYHWTLLVFDIQDKEWRHFNSKKPRDQGSQDPYMADALILKTYVERYMANMHGKKQEPRRTLFQDQDFNAPISSVEEAPQQSETSVDCGIIVCYIAKQFANGDAIPTSMTTDEIRDFRVELFHTFVHEIERSLSYENWQKQRRSKEKARTRDGEENDGYITTN